MPQKPVEMAPNEDGLTLTTSKATYAPGDTIELEIKNSGAQSVFVFKKNFPAGLEFEGQVLQKKSGAKEFSPLVLWEDIPNMKKRPAPSVIEIRPSESIVGNWNGKAYHSLKEDATEYFPLGTFKIKILYETAESFESNKYYDYSFSAQSNEFEVDSAGNLLQNILKPITSLFKNQKPSVPQNSDGLTLSTSKLVYAPGETIELEIKNNGTKAVYFQESRFNELGLSGEVIGIAGRGEALEPTNTFDSADASAPHDREPAKIFSVYPGISWEAMKAGYSYPYNWEETLPNTLKTKWTGFAFRKTGSQVYELEKYQSMGKFKIRLYYGFFEGNFAPNKDVELSYVESNEFEITGNSTVTPTGYKTTEFARQELELTGELFQQLTVGYRSQYNLRVTDPQGIEKIVKAGLAADKNLYQGTEKEIILNTFLPSKRGQELVGKKVRVTGVYTATLYEDGGGGETLQLETPQVIQRFDADAVTISTPNSDNDQTIPLHSATIVPLDKVIRKSPQEAMFSLQELETLGVALNPDLKGAKWEIILVPEPATVTPEIGGSVMFAVRKLRLSSIREATISITQFKGNRMDGSDAIDFAKADYNNSVEKDKDIWSSLPEPIVGNERIAGLYDNSKFKQGESYGTNFFSMFIQFRRNNFVVYAQLSDYGTPQAPNSFSVKALRELQTYAVLIDDKIGGVSEPVVVPYNKGDLIITTSKTVYQKNEPVEFEIRNNGNKQVYLMDNTDFDALSVSGNVLSLVGPNAFSPLNTFDTRASVMDTAGRIPPSPSMLKPSKGFLKGTWNGFAFRPNGPDPLNDWETFQPTGKFKISIVYAFESSDLTRAQDRELPYVESNEFEIR